MNVHPDDNTGSYSADIEINHQFIEPVLHSLAPNSVDIDAIYDLPPKHSLHAHASFKSYSLDNPYVMHAINQHNRTCMIPADCFFALATLNVQGISEKQKFLSVIDALKYKNI